MTGYAFTNPINWGRTFTCLSRKARYAPHARTRASLLPNHSAASPADCFSWDWTTTAGSACVCARTVWLDRATIASATHPATNWRNPQDITLHRCDHASDGCWGVPSEGHLVRFIARPERFELPTLCFEGRRSIQLSYGRAAVKFNSKTFRLI